MTDLIGHMTQIGFTNVTTYIQSGNIIFDFQKTELITLETLIKEKILKVYGFDVPVIVLTSTEIKTIIENNPFRKELEAKPKSVHLTFLAKKPNTEILKQFEKGKYPNEEFVIDNKAVYLYIPNGYGRAKLNNNFLENKLKVNATTRNWNTVLKLDEMLKE